jgi:hypothetical protein
MNRVILTIFLISFLYCHNYIKAQVFIDFNRELDSIKIQNFKTNKFENGFYLVKNNYSEKDTIGYASRILIQDDIKYNISYRPIALQKNITRIYEFIDNDIQYQDRIRRLNHINYSKDSIQGLIFNFNNINSTELCEIKNYTRDCYSIGLVYNDSLICISDLYDFNFIPEHKSVRFPFDFKYTCLKNYILKSLRPTSIKIIKVETSEINPTLKNLKIIDTNNYQIEFILADSALGGLRPSYPIAVSKELSGFSDILSISRSFHAIYNYFVFMNNEIIEINTPEKFTEIFGPVEDKEEAFSFAYAMKVTPGSEIIFDFDFIVNNEEKYVFYKKNFSPPSIVELDNGFEISWIKHNLSNEYFEETYFVSKTGDIKLIKREFIFYNKKRFIF